jgi:hypothetical protein
MGQTVYSRRHVKEGDRRAVKIPKIRFYKICRKMNTSTQLQGKYGRQTTTTWLAAGQQQDSSRIAAGWQQDSSMTAGWQQDSSRTAA